MIHRYLETAIQAAQSAGKILLGYRLRIHELKIEEKGVRDAVTNADQDAEAEIIRHIKEQFPDHSILAEESGSTDGVNSKVLWIIDPLDGTINFINGVPYFCISIGIQVNGQMEHGVVYNPLSNELFYASRGTGAYLNGERIQVAKCPDVKNALLTTHFAYLATNQHKEEVMASLEAAIEICSDVRCNGSAALELAGVASGRYTGYWGAGLKPWDIAAGALLVQEAGGVVTDYAAQDDFLYSGKIIAAPQNIHAILAEHLMLIQAPVPNVIS